jgi:hypothetical protein
MNPNTLPQPFHLGRCLAVALAIALLAFAGSGCRSLSGPASASFASVTIANHTAEEIASMTAMVFQEDGYTGGRTADGQIVFEKEASKATSLAREGMVSSYYGGTTINRMRMTIVPLSGGSFRLQGQAYMVTGGTDKFFQDEVPLSNLRSGPYKVLLQKVKSKLN